jgi:hypothetical protein
MIKHILEYLFVNPIVTLHLSVYEMHCLHIPTDNLRNVSLHNIARTYSDIPLILFFYSSPFCFLLLVSASRS